MRKVLMLLTAVSLLNMTPSLAADTVKLKHSDSLYKDVADLPIKQPEGVACNPSTLFVADTGNRQLVRFTLQNQVWRPTLSIPLPAASPSEVQLTVKGDVYVLDNKSRSILKLTAAGALNGSLSVKGDMKADKMIPKSFKLDSNGNIYILDVFSGRVVVADSAEAFLRQYDLPAGSGFISDLAVNNQGTIYLLDSIKPAIYQLSAGAEEFTLLSKGMEAFVNFPTHLAIDGRGLLYVIDQHGSGLVLLGRDGSFIGRKLTAGWNEAMLQYPAQVCIINQETLFIADRDNNRVQVFSILGE